jgi:hypothetical protein
MVLCANKTDLPHTMTDQDLTRFSIDNRFDGGVKTSAKTGENVSPALA